MFTTIGGKSQRAGNAEKCNWVPALHYIGDYWIHNSDFASHSNKFLLSINKQTKLNQLHICQSEDDALKIAEHKVYQYLPRWYGDKEIRNIRRLCGGEGVGDYPSWVTKNNAHIVSEPIFMLDCWGQWKISSCCVLVHRCMIIRIVQPYTVTCYRLTAVIIYSFTMYLKYIILTLFSIVLVFMIQLLTLCLCRAEE